VFAVTFVLLGAPISNQTFDAAKQPLEFVLSASTGSLVVVAVLMLRIYLGWAYVQERLRSAAVPYEETGCAGQGGCTFRHLTALPGML
jgi:hypothetical protein